MSGDVEKLANGRIELALHDLSGSDHDPAAPALLLLHALRGSSGDFEAIAPAWPGPVRALDFAGHGASAWIPGGGYTPETFVADADVALATLDGRHGDDAREADVFLAGAGIGSYVAFLLAAARRTRVPAALLLPGTGFAGGGAEPDYTTEVVPVPNGHSRDRDKLACDPLVASCEDDLRPVDYAEEFARAARMLLIASHEQPAPPWLETVERFARIQQVESDAESAIRVLAEVAQEGTQRGSQEGTAGST